MATLSRSQSNWDALKPCMERTPPAPIPQDPKDVDRPVFLAFCVIHLIWNLSFTAPKLSQSPDPVVMKCFYWFLWVNVCLLNLNCFSSVKLMYLNTCRSERNVLAFMISLNLWFYFLSEIWLVSYGRLRCPDWLLLRLNIKYSYSFHQHVEEHSSVHQIKGITAFYTIWSFLTCHTITYSILKVIMTYPCPCFTGNIPNGKLTQREIMHLTNINKRQQNMAADFLWFLWLIWRYSDFFRCFVK